MKGSVGAYSDFTYEEYLQNWDVKFGDAVTGDYGYYWRSTYVPVTVNKLSPDEFQDHVKQLRDADHRFLEAKEAADDDGMELALAEAFPHELALLI